jgi:hypothetical protein
VKKVSVLLSIAVILASLPLSAAPKYKIKQLQGAWWSDFKNPTADFGIQGDQVWLDFDSAYHPCRIEGDILIFELGPELGPVKNRIVSIKGHHLVLQNLASEKKWFLTRTTE